MYNPKRRHIKGFSLIELSIAILVISLIATFALSTLVSNKTNTSIENNAVKMQQIYAAMTNFLATNKRLPCPSTLTNIKGDSSYGVAATTPGTCTGLETAGEIVYGMVPFRDLGISQEMAEDSYGTRFSYAVDRRFTLTSLSKSSTTGFEIIKAMPSVDVSSEVVTIITIQSPSGTNVMTNALFVIIGHGSNRSNGWSVSSRSQNPAISSDETSNSGRSTNTTGTVHDATFIASSTTSGFDDMLLFKNKYQLVVDAGLDRIMCSGNEATAPSGNCSSYSWAPTPIKNGVYNSVITSIPISGNCCARTCGEYGVWLPIVATVVSCS